MLRVLGNLLNLSGCDYQSSEAVRDELRTLVGERRPSHARVTTTVTVPAANSELEYLERIGDVPLYATDALVRRAAALQAMADSADAMVRINAAEAARLGLNVLAQVTQGEAVAVLPVVIDVRVPDGAVSIAAARPGSATLGAAFGHVEVKPA